MTTTSQPDVPQQRDPHSRRNVRLAIPGLTTLESDHLRDGPRIDPDQLRDRRDRVAARALPLLTGALGVLLLLSSVFRLTPTSTAPGAAGAVVSAVTGVALLATAVLLRRRSSAEGSVYPAGLAVLLISGIALAVAMLTGGTLGQTAYFEVVVVVAGAAMLRPGWFAVAVGGIWALWLGATAALAATTDAAGWVLAMLAATVMSVVIHTMRTDSLRALGGALLAAEHQAVRDPLTKLLNRRGLKVVGAELLALAKRTREPLSCTLVAIDDLDAVISRSGDGSGDRLVAGVGDVLCGVFREADVVARTGVDEFVVLSLGAGPRVEEVERRLLERMSAAAAGAWHTSFSAGRVVHMPWQDEGLDGLLDRAAEEMERRRRLRRARSGDSTP